MKNWHRKVQELLPRFLVEHEEYSCRKFHLQSSKEETLLEPAKLFKVASKTSWDSKEFEAEWREVEWLYTNYKLCL